jgi:GH15 family glucan-1,4-alpha-glucosidase
MRKSATRLPEGGKLNPNSAIRNPQSLMPRDIPVGNGSLLVTFDEFYRIRDIYFPYVGKENHSEGHPFRFGVWAGGAFSWVEEKGWRRELRYEEETLVTDVRLINERLGVAILCSDAVDFYENIFLRRLVVKNLTDEAREVRLFLHHDFYISETEVGDTAYFDPDTMSLIHYKGQRYFLISTDLGLDSFATGRKAFQGQEGTWRDAEDGKLELHAITEGSVDSTIGQSFNLAADGEAEFYYWIAAGTSHHEVAQLNKLIRDKSPAALLERTRAYWRAWVNKNDLDFDDLPAHVVRLFKRSLLVTRTQIDARGAILAANDSDVTLRATDHYSYLWPRDGALVAHALDLAGYSGLTRQFFDLCASLVTPEGYFLQKYNPDGSVASGWHASWDPRTRERLVPIQEDETALILWALWPHYDRFRDIEFIRHLYRSLIIRAADFMVNFRDPVTKLPKPSWNLWEDHKAVHSFTCASVVGGLRAAARFARLFGEVNLGVGYETAANEIVHAMRAHLYRPELGRFARAVSPREGGFDVDATLDASLFGLWYFGAFAANDPLVVATMEAVEKGLWANTDIGGLARYTGDGYLRVVAENSVAPGNPWFICTLWLAEYYVARGDLQRALEILDWVTQRALPSGVLAEQVNPLTGAPVSVSPLTWSHATFVAVVMNYLRRRRDF